MAALPVAMLGCGAPAPPAPADESSSGAGPPSLRAGQPYRLDPGRVLPAIAAIASGRDELRILYQREGSAELRYVVLQRERGVTTSESLAPQLLPKRLPAQGYHDLDLAFDGDAVLHALVGGRHLALRDRGWTIEEGPPCEAFVRGGPRLLCVGPPTANSAIKHRWEWTFFPIFPPLPTFMPSRTSLRTLATYVRWPDGWHFQGIVDAASDLQTWAFRAAATPGGDLHAVFARAGKYGADWRYEFAPGIAPDVASAAAPQASVPPAPPADRTLDANCDPPPRFMEVGARWPLDALSIDADGGSGVVVAISYRARLVCQRRIRPGSLGRPEVVFAGRQFTGVWLARLGDARRAIVLAELAAGSTAAAGKALFSYAVFDAGRWSGTAGLGLHDWSAAYGGDAPLVGRGEGRAALVAIDADDRPVVIWLEPTP